jgi:hypothetical protein
MHDERDTRKTPYRLKMQALYRERQIIPARTGFRCQSLDECSESGRLQLRTGDWAFVGAEYGKAKIEGHAARILFVAMDRGGYAGAGSEVFQNTQASFRRSIESPRNPHMGGVALILKHLVGERDVSKLSSQCALVNAVKCAKRTDRMSTETTRLMISNCADHLLAEIRALNPDLIVTQGAHPMKTVVSSMADLCLVQEFAVSGRGKARVFTNSRLVVLTTPHPARQSGLKWSRGILPQFFIEAIALARTRLVGNLRRRNRRRSA